MKAIIVDIDGKHAVALNRKGAFIKIKNKTCYKIGCEVDVSPSAGLSKTVLTRTAPIAAGFLMVMSIGAGAYSYSLPYSYINVDINPSIEFTANIYNRIIKAEGLNDDGNKLLSLGAYRNKTVRDSIEGVLESAYEEGYLREDSGNAIVFALSGRNDKKVGEIEKEIEAAADNQLQSAASTTEVLVQQLPVKQHDDARKQGISPGKLLLINRLKEVSPEIEVDDFKDDPVREIMKSIKDARKEDKVEDNDKDVKEYGQGVKQANQDQNDGKDDKDKDGKDNNDGKVQGNGGVGNASNSPGDTGVTGKDDQQSGEKEVPGEKDAGKDAGGLDKKDEDDKKSDGIANDDKKDDDKKSSNGLKTYKNEDTGNKKESPEDDDKDEDKGNSKVKNDKKQVDTGKNDDGRGISSSSSNKKKGLFWWIFGKK